jgi:hypothetical protein
VKEEADLFHGLQARVARKSKGAFRKQKMAGLNIVQTGHLY